MKKAGLGAALALLALTIAGATAAPAAAAVSVSCGAPTTTIDLGTAPGARATIVRSGTNLQVTNNGNSTTASCPLASVVTVVVTGSGFQQEVKINLSGGAFTGAGEISFNLDVPDFHSFGLGFSSGNDHVVFGQDGVNLNSDTSTTRDVNFNSHPNLLEPIYGLGGADSISVAGGSGTGSSLANWPQVTVEGGSGEDTLTGAAASGSHFYDTPALSYEHASGPVYVNLGQGGAQVGGEVDVLSGFLQVNGSAFGDYLVGSDGEDGFLAGGGNDTIYGLGAHDEIYGEAGNDTAYGNAGNDIVYADLGVDKLYGGDGDDDLFPGDDTANDLVDGGPARDTADYGDHGDGDTMAINLTSGTATGRGTDTLTGVENAVGNLGGPNTIVGTAGPNVLRSGFGASSAIYGIGGNDNLSGNGQLYGGDGNDVLANEYGPGAEDGTDDVMDGGNGFDVVDYFYAMGGIQLTLASTPGQTAGAGGHDTLTAIEGARGTQFGDTLVGSAGVNIFAGAAGNDTLYGLGANDVLYGGDGDDTINGGPGADTCQQNAGTGTLTSCP